MRSYIFPTITMVTALALAAGAALFTILGFREMFEPSFKITYMAASIEMGKIIAISALYQLRHIMGWAWKSFAFFLILVAMAVTSMGVYGYLSSAFQKDSLSITQNESRLELLDSRKTALEARLVGIDLQIAEVPESYVTKRMELIATFKPERESILQEVEELDDRKLELTLEKIDRETEFGAVILLAKSVEWIDEDKAMLYFILAVIFIFDPLAVALTYAANVGYATVAANREEAKKSPNVPVPNVSGSESNSNILGEIGDMLEGAISPVAESVSKVSDEVENLKNATPSNPRADVVESMRSKEGS